MKRTNKIIAWVLILAMLLSGCSSNAKAEEQSLQTSNTTLAAEMTDAAKSRQEKMLEISETLLSQEEISEWMIFDLAAYGSEIPAQKKDAYVEAAKEAVNGEYAAATDFAKAAIIFAKLGIDVSDSGGTNIPEKIQGISEFNTYSDAIWVLISDTLDSIELSDEQKRKAVEKISESVNEKGIIFGSYGGYVYEDADSTGAAIGALSALADSGDTYGAEALREKMITALSQSQLESGSFGSACTDAFVIIGLCAANIDADKDARFQKGENSLLDGLMSYAISGGFAGYDGALDIAWSTEQGFRALVAYEGFVNAQGAYDIYYSATDKDDSEQDELPEEDEENRKPENNSTGKPSGGLEANTNQGKPSDNESENGSGNSSIEKEENKETPDNEVSGGKEESKENPDENDSANQDEVESEQSKEEESDNPEDAENEEYITVSFEMRTHKARWLRVNKVKTSVGISVRDFLSQIFDEYGVDSNGLSGGYLRSVTYNGETWAEFDAGPSSGWQYFVNGSLPRVGIASYKLKDKDSLELVYTADYTGEENKADEDEKEEKSEETIPGEEAKEDEEITNDNTPVWENPFSDVKEDDWFFSDVRNVCMLGLMKGVADSSFAPKSSLSRAMFVTVLYRLEGEPEADAEKFSDVEDGDWFRDAVAWASSNGIVNGVDEDSFAPNKAISREQMATIAYRYASMKNKQDSGNVEVSFEDASEISDYAHDAVAWASENGIMKGNANKFNPKAETTRCEAAAVFGRIYTMMKNK